MSLDLYLLEKGEEKFWRNITHNLGKMADEIVIDGVSLYKLLWRPDENGFKHAKEEIKLLKKAIDYMIEEKEELIKFNPENGWGSYDGLLEFTIDFYNSCKKYPESEIEASR